MFWWFLPDLPEQLLDEIYTLTALSKQNVEYLIFLVLICVESILANAC